MTSPSEKEGESGSLKLLCTTSLKACHVLTPLITAIYNDLSSNEVKMKKDNSAFTIADGLVQRLLYVLFAQVNFRDCVGEEDATVNDSWDQVDGLMIPTHILPIVQSTKSDIESLSGTLSGDYSNVTIFVDPIDGTKEFSTGKGEQCSICIGFADENGNAIGGVVYRPLTENPSWAAGAESENYREYNFGVGNDAIADGGLLTSNGSISPFVESLMNELSMKRVKAGGAGNKMLLLLERSLQLIEEDYDGTPKNSMVYIQDRGVSRWDTCGAEAVLRAFGGDILKLTSMESNGTSIQGRTSRYTYLASDTNLDFLPGSAHLTKYNCASKEAIQPNQIADDVSLVKPYSNLCGLAAFGKEWNSEEGLKHISDSVKKAALENAPAYD